MQKTPTAREQRKNREAKEAQNIAIYNDFNMDFNAIYLGNIQKKEWDYQEVKRYAVTLTNKKTRQEMRMDFFQGIGHKFSPLPFDVLHCIRMDDTQGEIFADWCGNFGYDTDSRKALDTYLQCQQQTFDFRQTFPQVDLQNYEPLEDY